MKKLLLVFLFISTSYAENFYFYTENLVQLKKILEDNGLDAQYVFNPEEQKILKKLGRVQNLLKVKSTLKKIKSLKLNGVRIEQEKMTKFHQYKDEFWKRQWALFNRGLSLKIPVTDIEYRTVEGIEGEDIQLQGLPPETNRKIKVALVDSGVALNHPDLKEQIYRNESECKAQRLYELCLKDDPNNKECHKRYANLDTDGNGYPRDCQGWNVAAKKSDYVNIPGNNKVDDILGHGTHSAGVIGAKANDIGVRGVIQNVEIIPVKVNGEVNGDENLGIDIFAKGILYAISTGAEVINLSIGWSFQEDSELVREMIQLAHSRGIIVVAAAGNSSHNLRSYPCAYEEVLCVAAHSVDGKLASFTTYGPHVDLAAPGEEIFSTWPEIKRPIFFEEREGYEIQSGSSFSAPYVTAAAARLLNYGFSPREVIAKLTLGSRDRGELDLRYGKLDLKKAYQFKPNSFVVPLTKKLNLVDWRLETKKLKLELKNLGFSKAPVEIYFKSNDLIFDQSDFSFSQMDLGDHLEIELNFQVKDINISPYVEIFAEIQQGQTKNTFPIALEFVHPLRSQELTEISEPIKLKSKGNFPWPDFLLSANVFPIQSSKDKLVIVEKGEQTFVTILRYTEQGFELSEKPEVLKGGGYLFVNNSFLDVNGDGVKEYVFLVYRQVSKEVTIEFKVFDLNFNPLDAERVGLKVPENAFIRNNFVWINNDKKMLPAWIQKSIDPQVKQPPLKWDLPVENKNIPRVLYISNNELFSLKTELTPLHLFSRDKQTVVIVSEGEGALKDFFTLEYKGLKKHSEKKITPEQYFAYDLAKITGDGLQGKSFIIERQKSLNYTLFSRGEIYKVPTTFESFKKVYSVIQIENEPYIAFLRGNSLEVSNGVVSAKINKLADQRKDPNYYILKSQNSNGYKFYRSSTETLGLSLDLITVESQDGEMTLSRKANEAFVMGDKCTEFSVEKSALLFYCSDTFSLYRYSL